MYQHNPSWVGGNQVGEGGGPLASAGSTPLREELGSADAARVESEWGRDRVRSAIGRGVLLVTSSHGSALGDGQNPNRTTVPGSAGQNHHSTTLVAKATSWIVFL